MNFITQSLLPELARLFNNPQWRVVSNRWDIISYGCFAPLEYTVGCREVSFKTIGEMFIILTTRNENTLCRRGEGRRGKTDETCLSLEACHSPHAISCCFSIRLVYLSVEMIMCRSAQEKQERKEEEKEEKGDDPEKKEAQGVGKRIEPSLSGTDGWTHWACLKGAVFIRG